MIALLALTGVASADYSGSFSWTTGEIPAFMFDNAPDGLYLMVDEVKVNSSATSTPKTNEVYPGTVTPDVNVGDGGTWSMGFSIINWGTETLTLKSITLDAFAFNSGGKAQSSDTLDRDIVFALTGAAEVSVVHSFTNINTTQDGMNWDSNPTLTFAAPLEIAEGDFARFVLTVSEDDSVGCFIGLTGATLVTPTAAVPEPTTATLSLLALAGLAARRRR